MSNSMMHILVCLDFSESSTMALSHAVRLAERLQARLHLCHIARDKGLLVATNMGLNIPDNFPQAKQARRRLQRQLAVLGATVDAEVHVRLGTPVEGILSLVSEIMPDLLVVCSHGRGVIRRALLGSVSRQLALRSPVPVLIVPAPGRELFLQQPPPSAEAELPSIGHSVLGGDSDSGATGVGIASVGGAQITYR